MARPGKVIHRIMLLLLLSAAAISSLGQTSPPKILSRPEPRSPECLYDTRTPGRVLLKIAVNQNGKPTEVTGIYASYPDFVAPSIEALKKCHFAPAMADGQPVDSILYFTQTYGVMTERNHSDATNYGYGLEFVKDAKGSDGTKADVVEPGAKQIVTPVYPFELLMSGCTGKAEAEFKIDEYGQVFEVQILSASRPEFGEAIRAMGEACGFEAATHGDKAIGCVVRKKQNFSPGADYLTYNSETKHLVRALKAQSKEVVEAERLDRRLKRLYSPNPELSAALKQQRPKGNAIIEFYVDREGRAQLPRIVSSTENDYGWAAATAVQQWVFEQPTQGGKPVFAKMQIQFDF